MSSETEKSIVWDLMMALSRAGEIIDVITLDKINARYQEELKEKEDRRATFKVVREQSQSEEERLKVEIEITHLWLDREEKLFRDHGLAFNNMRVVLDGPGAKACLDDRLKRYIRLKMTFDGYAN